MITRTFSRERETKRTVRFQEDGPEAEHVVGALYVRKDALAQLGNPEALGVVLGAVAEFDDE